MSADIVLSVDSAMEMADDTMNELQEVGGVITDLIGKAFKPIIWKIVPWIITEERVKYVFDNVFNNLDVWASYTSNKIDDVTLQIVRDGFDKNFKAVFALFKEFLSWVQYQEKEVTPEPTPDVTPDLNPKPVNPNVTPVMYGLGVESTGMTEAVFCAKLSEETGISLEIIKIVVPVVIYFIKMYFGF